MIIVNGVYIYYARSPLRLGALNSAQKELGSAQLAPLRTVETRWISHYAPMQRVSERMNALVLHVSCETMNASGSYLSSTTDQMAYFTNLERCFLMAVMRPALNQLHILIKSRLK